MVAAADGNVKRVDLFLHDSHAGAAEAADDGTTRARAVGTVVDTRLVADRRADVVHHLAAEFVGCQHVAGLGESIARKRVCRDDDLLYL